MEIKIVKRYYTDCGKEYKTKKGCENHEYYCKCWTNPKYKTCLSCKYKNLVYDSNGMELEPQFLQTWTTNDCKNPEMNLNTMFTPAHEKADYICINCPKWVYRKESGVNNG